MLRAPRPLWRRALRGLLLVVAALALAEAAVALLVREPARGIHFAARSTQCCALDPLLIWHTIASAPGATPATPGTERVNSLGLRGGETGAKAAGVLRVLTLGDESTYGAGVGESEAYPAQLEVALRAQAFPAEVLNAGQPGYGSDQMHRAFAMRWARLAPDAVVAGIHCSDLAGDIDQPLYDVRAGILVGLDARFNWIYLQGKAVQLVPEFLSKRKLYRWLVSGLERSNAFGQVPFRSEEALRDWQRDKIVLEVADLVRMGGKWGFSVAAVLMPCRDTIAGITSPPLYGDLAERLRAAGITTLDAGLALRARGLDVETLLQPNSQLLNARGNAALAREVAEVLRATLPQPSPAASAASPH